MGFGNLGFGEIIFILLVLLLVFGARRLPEIGQSLGKGIREFKKSMTEIGGELNNAVNQPQQPPQQYAPPMQPYAQPQQPYAQPQPQYMAQPQPPVAVPPPPAVPQAVPAPQQAAAAPVAPPPGPSPTQQG